MIRNTLWEFIFIRSCIIFLHYITPLSILSSFVLVYFRFKSYRVHWVIEALVLAETAFYFLVYLPLHNHIQRPAKHPKIPSNQERKELYRKCRETISDPVKYLSKWFLDAPLEEIKRENLKEFFRWAFLNSGDVDSAYDEELEDYVKQTEEQLGRPIQPGRGRAKCLRLTLDDVNVLHRSLTWYMCVFVVDTITCVSMLWHSFQFYRPSAFHIFSSFPLRPLCLFSDHQSPTKKLSYWHRPHTAKNKLPVVFLHGIGIGLYPYVKLLAEFNQDSNSKDDGDGQIGVIAIELMCISFRMTHEALSKEEICSEVRAILQHHNIDEFVLVTHSYGSIIATHLLHNTAISPKINALLFIDPVSLLLHLPDVAYNFTHRSPTTAPEHQLYYFASKDPNVQHTLARRFFWSESVLWKADLAARRATVVLGGRDLIVDTRAVARYLLQDESDSSGHNSDGANTVDSGTTNQAVPYTPAPRPWRGVGIDVLWFEDLDHMQTLDTARDRATLVKVVRAYCAGPRGAALSEKVEGRRG